MSMRMHGNLMCADFQRGLEVIEHVIQSINPYSKVLTSIIPYQLR